MKKGLRKSGIDIIGEVPWGTHFCQFYQTKQDLIDTLVPYFKAGLENNEFCMWITSQPLDVEEAKKALRRAVPEIDVYLEKGQIEIIPYDRWYVTDGIFDSQRVLNSWIEKLGKALAKGYDGLRLSGNMFWLEREVWNEFAEYEEQVDNIIGNYHMMALCAYSLNKCTATDIIDVVINHQFALVKKEGTWEQIESSRRKQAEDGLLRKEKELNEAQKIAHIGSWYWDARTDAWIVSDELLRIFGQNYPSLQEQKGTMYPPESWDILNKAFQKTLHTGSGYELDLEALHEHGYPIWIIMRGEAVRDARGEIIGLRGTVQDITKRKRDEEALREAYEDLQVQSEELEAQTEDLQEAYEALSESKKRFELLSEANALLLSSKEPETVIQTIARKVMYHLNCDVFFNYVFDEAQGRLHLNAYGGIGEETAKEIEWLDKGTAICGCVARDGCRIVSEDVQHNGDERADLVRSMGIQAYSCQPLHVGEKTIGTLSFGTKSRKGFTGDELALMSAVADQVSVGIERKRAEKALRESEARRKVDEAVQAERERLNSVLDMLPAYVILISPDYRVPFTNHFFEERFGKSEGRRCYEYLFQYTEPCENCETCKVFKTGAPHRWEWTGPDGRNYDVYDYPFKDTDGSTLVMEMGIDITEKKKAEMVLRLANAYNRSLIEASVDPLVTIGPDGEITDVNNSTEFVTGYSREELIGTDFSDYFTEPEKAREGYQHVFLKGMVRDYPLEIQHREGHITPVLYNASVYRDEAGEVIGVFAAARDITELKKAEEKIQILAKVVESSDDAIIAESLDGIIINWNKGAEQIYGYSAEEILGKSVSILEPDKLKGEIEQLIEKVKQREKVQHYETLRLRKDGMIINISITLSPVLNTSGEIVAISTIARDITEVKKAQEALKLSNIYNRSLIEASLDPFVTIGPEGKITDVNRATEMITGYSRDELIGTNFSDYFTGPEEASKGYQQVFREGLVLDYELAIQHRDGDVTPVLYNASVYRDEAGEVIGVFAAARDITEQKKAEALLKLKMQELARSNAELEQFAYVSSHDLQEPLRMIASYLQLLQRKYQGKLDDKADKYIYFAVDGASRMQNLINDLLEFSRVTTKAREFEPTDCESLLNQVMFNLEVPIKENKASITRGTLPVVMADPIQLAQVFQNLISNAIKFRSEGAPEIEISVEKKANEWLFSVKDNGIGIEARFSERIFEVFKRLNKREEYPGTGIGLSICKKIVERHGGHIWVESVPGEGSVFHFTLPTIPVNFHDRDFIIEH